MYVCIIQISHLIYLNFDKNQKYKLLNYKTSFVHFVKKKIS